MTPYADLPERCFWKTGVSRADPLTITDLYQPKFAIRPQDWVATAGSCFAQYVTGALKGNGYRVMDVEPGPPWLDEATLQAHGYGQYSARYGNVYTARQLHQLACEAFDGFRPAEIAWSRKGRWYDALRPGVDPAGLDSREEVEGLRAHHVARVAKLFSSMNVFIFTLGLTEAWADSAGTTIYPTAPGVIAGRWSPEAYRFVNFTASEVLKDLRAFREIVLHHNRHAKIILTVSPVPLSATASEDHVLQATTYSKSALRAAAGEMALEDGVDYFPSYELIATPFSRAGFYESNLRNVSPGGVSAAMRLFFAAHPPIGGALEAPVADPPEPSCEEQLAEAFAP